MLENKVRASGVGASAKATGGGRGVEGGAGRAGGSPPRNKLSLSRGSSTQAAPSTPMHPSTLHYPILISLFTARNLLTAETACLNNGACPEALRLALLLFITIYCNQELCNRSGLCSVCNYGLKLKVACWKPLQIFFVWKFSTGLLIS